MRGALESQTLNSLSLTNEREQLSRSRVERSVLE